MSYTIYKPNGKKICYNDRGHLSLVEFYPRYTEEKQKGIKYKIFGSKPGHVWQYYLYQIIEDGVCYDVFESNLTREWFVHGSVTIFDRFCNGIANRENGPAFEHYGDYDVWHKNGQKHRIGAPAYEMGANCINGEEWHINGKLHREDGPAVIIKNDGAQWDGKYWYINNKKHRIDGPAIELDSGIKEWYSNNEKINCSSQKEFEKMLKLKVFW